ncbi:PspC domain-containing protein [Hymenobacter sp. BRD128]|uniref:GIN domain-containing protein n=1 Tax=Hymenobacter sp. BRD128 TaxID=2675878 RepID=UPI001563F30A|nr:PspC domain-containing protein [Hymenobacter sp. BRD128]QKG55864.1 PspC domain-containing protein [Hymenobacter sp. BRD128]
MKKNISINLQGIIFHLEDDGYEVLSRYLQEVKAHFASYQGHEEIVADIEGRIAELFSARLSPVKQVITLQDVEEMTAKMGRVSDFQTSPDEDEDTYAEPAATAAGAGRAFTGGPTPADTEPRRLYRDLAHRKIAGVCAGLAQYFRVNPLLVRLIFLALVLLPNVFGVYDHIPGTGMFRHRFDFGGLALIAYVVLWIALPKRDDAPEPIDTLDFGGKLTGRKLFRDVDNGKVGGVSAGLAAYFQTDVVLVRVLFLIGLFLGGSSFIIYLILWAVVPEARTVSEKMQMRGDAVTLSGIDNNLRSNAFEGEIPPAPNRPLGTYLETAARGARPAVNFLGTLIRWVVGLLLIFWGGSWLFSVLTVLGAALSIIPFTAVEHTSNGFMFDDSFGALVRNLPPWGAIAGALLLGIPGLGLLLLGLRLLLRRPVLGRSASGVLLGLWLLGVVGSTAAGLQVARDFQAKDTYTTTVRLQPIAGPGIVLDSRNVEDHFQRVNLALAPADSGAAPFVEEEFRARGRTEEAARLTAQQTINYNIVQRDSTIIFDQGITLKSSAAYREQKLNLTLHLPLNKIYRLTPLFIERLDDEDFTNGHRPSGDRAYRARFTREGKFTCLDCPPSADNDDTSDGDAVVNLDVNGNKTQVRVNTDGDEPRVNIRSEADRFNTDPGYYGTGRKATSSSDEFSEVEVHGPFRVVLSQGDSYKAEAAGRPADLADVRLDIRGNRLVVRNRAGGLFSGFDMSRHPILVQITLPRLRHLELSGACQAEASGFRDEDLRLEASSASSARLDVHVPKLELQLSSASQVNLTGAANELTVDGSSASQLEALSLSATRANIDLSSGSQAKVRATDELKVDLSSGSVVRYAGHPRTIAKDLSSGSSLEEVSE